MPRKRLTKAQKAAILDRQHHTCPACEKPLTGAVEYDHVIALALGGADDPNNLECIHDHCHKSRTRQDVKDIARAKRRERFMQEGRHRKRKGRPMQSRGFSKTYRKKMNGEVVKNG